MRKIKCWNCGSEVEAAKSETLCPSCRTMLSASSTIMTRTCRACGATFLGGPRAWYCPECRADRAKASSRESKARAKAGTARKIGSTDICQICGQKYIVNGSLQKYCPDCAKDAVQQIDREQSRAWANAHRESLLDRKKRLVQTRKICVVCGSQFYTGTATVTCSQNCAKILKSYNQAVADHKRRGSPAPTMDAVKERISKKSAFPGVTRSKNGKRWIASFCGKYLGTFDTVEEAAASIKKVQEEIE